MTTITHLSGVYAEEGSIPDCSTALDLLSLEGSCCYCSPEAAARIRQAIAGLPAEGIHWIDTGDYHYLSLFWMEKVKEDFVLALFDNHPDDQEGAFGESLLSCGSWVLEARESLPRLKGDWRNTANIPGDLPVWLSIDLDVLNRDFARTDWSQGDMTLPALLDSLDRIFNTRRVLAADVCGGLTAAKGATAEDLRINAATRRILQDYLSSQPLLAG